MKKLLFLFVFIPSASMASPIKFQKEIVQFNPGPVCAELIGIPHPDSEDFGYDEWRQFQGCMEYFRLVNKTF